MTTRISGERLAELIEYWRQPLTFRDLDVGNALEELQQSLALIAQQSERIGRLELQIRLLVNHWNEFGPMHGFDELVQYADQLWQQRLGDSTPMPHESAIGAQHEELVAKLRALAERMDKKQYGIPSLMNEYASGQQNAVDYWSYALTDLLAAHDAQQAEGEGE